MVGTGNKPGLDNPLEQCSEFEENLKERIKNDGCHQELSRTQLTQFGQIGFKKYNKNEREFQNENTPGRTTSRTKSSML